MESKQDMWWMSIEALEEVKEKKEEEERAATMAEKIESYSLTDSALHPGINLSNYRQLSSPHPHTHSKKAWVPNLFVVCIYFYILTIDALAPFSV